MPKLSSENISISEIAKLYYEDGLTQTEIARRVGLSRPIISKKLTEAKELGVVKIFINTDIDRITEMTRKIQSAFNLKGIKIEPVPGDDPKLDTRLAAKCAAGYLSGFIQEGDRVATGWGTALSVIADCFPQMNCSVDLIIQCVGNIDNVKSTSAVDGMLTKLAKKLNAREAFTFSWPVVVSNPIIANTIMYDKRVQELLACARSCNKIMVNLSFPDRRDCLYNLGYLSSQDMDQLEASGAVGNICGRFFDKDGNVCATGIDERIIGVTLEDIRKTECVMACVAGTNKSLPLYYALKAGLIQILVLDSFNAEELLKVMEEKG